MEDKKEFIEREWNEQIEGHLDDDGFFVTPNGSFWDPDYVYFNHEGFDKHGGKYDEKGEYIPGPGWDEEYNCYESEKEDEDLKDNEDDCEGDINYTEQDMMNELAGFDDDDDLLEGKNLTKLDPNIEIIVQKETDIGPEEEYEEEDEKGNENGENNNNNLNEDSKENNNENNNIINENNDEGNKIEEQTKESKEKNEEGQKERVFNITTKDNEKIVITGKGEDDKEGRERGNNNYNNNYRGKKHNNNYYNKNNNYNYYDKNYNDNHSYGNNNYYKNKNNYHGNNQNYNNKGNQKKYKQFNNFDELDNK